MVPFPRSQGLFVSVLIPTRGRVPWLLQAVDSVYSLAVNKDQLEFILKVDDDDHDTIAAAERLAGLVNLRALVSPRGNGYHDMHHWVNQMAGMATGDWLFLINDDVRVITQDWDHVLLHCGVPNCWHRQMDFFMLVAPTVGRPQAQEFFFLRRKVFEVLGHVSLNPHNDNWIYTVMSNLASVYQVPVMIDHFSDRIDDTIRRESVEAYKTTSPALRDRDSIGQKLEDACRLYRHICLQEKRSGQ